MPLSTETFRIITRRAINRIASINIAIIYHSVFNLLVQSNSTVAQNIGLSIPFLTYVIINLSIVLRIKNTNTSKKVVK